MSAIRSKLSIVAVLAVMIVMVSGPAMMNVQGLSASSGKPIAEIGNPEIITRVQGGPAANEVIRTWTSPASGIFHQSIQNEGLKGIEIHVYDVTFEPPTTCSTCLITFSEAGAYPNGTVQLGDFEVLKDHVYEWSFSPSGRVGTSAQYSWAFEGIGVPPVALFSFQLPYSCMVIVNATASYDPDGTIVNYEWTWGDGYTSTGVTSSHMYPADGTRYVTLTVTDDDGLTGSRLSSIPPPLPYLVGGYTYDSDGQLLTDCAVTVTNNRTGASLYTTSGSSAFYQVDLSTIDGGWDLGDLIVVCATKDTLIGWADGIASGGAYLLLHVTLY